MPKFLQHDVNCDESVSTVTTFDTAHLKDVSRRRVRPSRAINCGVLMGLSAALGFGSRIEKIVLGGSIKITNAFSYFWGVDSCLTVEMPLKPDGQNNLPQKRAIYDKVYELYYAEVKEDKSVGYSYNKPKEVTAWYVCSENLREEEEKLADFGTLSPSKIWARRKHYIAAAIKNKNKEYAAHHISAKYVTMIDDVGTVGCGFIREQGLLFHMRCQCTRSPKMTQIKMMRTT